MRIPYSKLLVITILLLSSTLSIATIRRVPSVYPTIQSAVNSSQDVDTVLLANGIYNEQVIINHRRLTLTGDFLFTHDTLDRERTTIILPDSIRTDTTSRKSVVIVHNSESFYLIGLTLRKGLGTYSDIGGRRAVWGGNLFADSSRLTIDQCRFTGGDCGAGGGIGGIIGSVRMTNCILDSNWSRVDGYGGGGAYFDLDTMINIKYCFFYRDSAACYGGGIFANSIGAIDSCSFIENYSGFQGGGVFSTDISSLCGNQFINNWSYDQAGFTIYSGINEGLLANNLILNNHEIDNTQISGTAVGGGIFQRMVTQHWTIVDNIFEGNNYTRVAEGALSLQNGIFDIRHNIFNRNSGRHDSAIQLMGSARANIDSNVFSNNSSYHPLLKCVITYMGNLIIIRHNDFSGNTPIVFYARTDYPFNPDSVLIDNNWWGDVNGPSVADDSLHISHGDSVDYRLHYRPWLTHPVFPTSVFEPFPHSTPNTFQLLSVAPNPFNLMTNITCDIPHRENIDLTMYDIIGRKVSVLFQGTSSAGMHRMTFDGSRYATGTYFVRLKAGNQIQVKKVLLLK